MMRKTSARKARNFSLATIGVMNTGIDAVITTPFQGWNMRTTPAITAPRAAARSMLGCAKGNTPGTNGVSKREEKGSTTITTMRRSTNDRFRRPRCLQRILGKASNKKGSISGQNVAVTKHRADGEMIPRATYPLEIVNQLSAAF